MKHSEFHIGREFWTATGKWRCTDIGTRTIIAIKLAKDDCSWYNGPPYAVAETSFDEDDIIACFATPHGEDARTEEPAVLAERDQTVASGAARYFAALFYQALGQLEPNDPGVWEFAMDELDSIAHGRKGKRTGRDYIREVMHEPEVLLSDD